MAASKAKAGSVVFLNCLLPSSGSTKINIILIYLIFKKVKVLSGLKRCVFHKHFQFLHQKTYHENMKQLWFCNSFLTASKPRWLLIGWQREQEVFFFEARVCDCCCWIAAVKGWLHDVEIEQCENRSHNGATSLACGGMLWVRGVCLLMGNDRHLKMEKWTLVREGW